MGGGGGGGGSSLLIIHYQRILCEDTKNLVNEHSSSATEMIVQGSTVDLLNIKGHAL